MVPELAIAPTVANALQEDLLGAWAPDVAAWVDLDAYTSVPSGASHVATHMRVPRPGGSDSAVSVLHPGWHVALHNSVNPLREILDAALAPGVFGYRVGAVAGRRYADDWRDFCAFIDDHSTRHSLLALTDVQSFFSSTPWDIAIASLNAVTDAPEVTAFSSVSRALDAGGVRRLPTGYADARFVANAVLARAEANLTFPFARWVDDYRVFIDSHVAAAEALNQLDAGLRPLGLQRNLDKTRTMPVREAVERHHQTLASVYHPERDPSDVVTQKLREIFDLAKDDPVTNRRQIRFVLPRLAEQGDDTALPFAKSALRDYPWEAPRLVAYLSNFVESHGLGPFIDTELRSAAEVGNAWLLSRLSPLATSVHLSPATLRALENSHESLVGTPAWGLSLRMLAQAGSLAPVQRALTGGAHDVRAVVVAARDLELTVPRWAQQTEPVLASMLTDTEAPPLQAETLL